MEHSHGVESCHFPRHVMPSDDVDQVARFCGLCTWETNGIYCISFLATEPTGSILHNRKEIAAKSAPVVCTLSYPGAPRDPECERYMMQYRTSTAEVVSK